MFNGKTKLQDFNTVYNTSEGIRNFAQFMPGYYE